MKAMLIFALFPLCGLFTMPLGQVFHVVHGRYHRHHCRQAHQSWSANVYNVVSDMFPKSAVATVTGACGLASGLGSFMSNKGAGVLFDHAESTDMTFLGFEGINAGYMIVFLVASFAYLFSWVMMKILVPEV